MYIYFLIFTGYIIYITNISFLPSFFVVTPLAEIVFTASLCSRLINCYIWSIALFGAEAWTLGKYIRNTLNVLKCGTGAGWRTAGPVV
jgi:hypothetical protein